MQVLVSKGGQREKMVVPMGGKWQKSSLFLRLIPLSLCPFQLTGMISNLCPLAPTLIWDSHLPWTCSSLLPLSSTSLSSMFPLQALTLDTAMAHLGQMRWLRPSLRQQQHSKQTFCWEKLWQTLHSILKTLAKYYPHLSKLMQESNVSNPCTTYVLYFWPTEVVYT